MAAPGEKSAVSNCILLARQASRCHRQAYVLPMLLSFLKCRPCHSTAGGRIAARIVEFHTVYEKHYYGYKFDEL